MTNESALCPWCNSEEGCQHHLLTVDRTFQEAVGGELFHAFARAWTCISRAHQDDPAFDETSAFDELLEDIDSIADHSCNYDSEGGPGMSSSNIAFYVRTDQRRRSARKKFDLQHKPTFEVSWADDTVVLQLSLSDRNWLKLTRGEPLSLRGAGYRYEGRFFWDYWDFLGGERGDLIVRYGSPQNGDYSAQGFVGEVFWAMR